MRILLLTHYYEPEVGAPQRRWRQLVEQFVSAGHQVAVCAPVPHYPFRRRDTLGIERPRVWKWSQGFRGELILRVPYIRASGSLPGQLVDQSASSLFMVAALASLRGGLRPDVIVATTPGLPMPFAAVSLAKALRVPLVTEVRDVWPDLIADNQLVSRALRGLVPPKASQVLENRALPAVFHTVLRRSDAIVTTTESFADRLRSRRMPPVTVVRNTGDSPRAQSPRPVREPRAGLHVLYVGTVGRSQQLETVIEAVAEVPDVWLRVVGAGAQWYEMRERASQLTERVEFHPQTTGQPLEAHWAWAHTGLVSLADIPSFELTIPSKLMSIMARGVHVTGVLAGEAAQIVRQSGAGAVASPGSVSSVRQVLEELRDDPVSVEVGSQPAEWLRSHASSHAAAAKYLTLFEELT